MPVEMEWREVYHNGERKVLSAEGKGKVFERNRCKDSGEATKELPGS